MSFNYQLIKDGDILVASAKNVEIPETLSSIGYAPTFHQRGSEQKLKFETCIISTFSDIFHQTSPDVTNIEVHDSIIDRIDLKILKKFTKLEQFKVINSTISDFKGTIFGNLKDFILKFEKDEATAEIKVAIVDGKIYLTDKDDEDVGDQVAGSGAVPKTNNGRHILTAKPVTKPSIFTPVTVPAPTNVLAHASYTPSILNQTPFSTYGQPASSTFGQPASSTFGQPASSTFGQPASSTFGQPASSTFGQPASSTFGQPASSTFGQTQSSFYGSTTLGPSSQAVNLASPKRHCDSQSDTKAPKNVDHRSNLKEKFTKSQTINANLSKELEVLRNQVMKLEAENKKFKESGILADLKKIFHDEAFKDFTVNVNNEKSFRIHKLLFAARSSVIADMLRSNSGDFELNLQDIPLPIFEILLHFIYNDVAPDGDVNLIATYAAAGRLDIKDLKNMTANKLMDKVDEKNAFKILELSNKYGNEELRMKAFEEIRKVLSVYKLSDEFSKKPEKIRKLLEMKRKMDEEYEMMQKELQDICEDQQEVSEDQQEVVESSSDSYEIVD
ncbi:uncharacterized protein [Chironomus tepperi]|uniref:uncharacterized protein isoform X1 n=1 Tax=Chironomus tepperi TaxID=113505 RepID=UPI00391F64FB